MELREQCDLAFLGTNILEVWKQPVRRVKESDGSVQASRDVEAPWLRVGSRYVMEMMCLMQHRRAIT